MCVMVVRGTFTFGPSRHSLYLFPVILFSIYGGTACCGDLLGKRIGEKNYNSIYITLISAVLLAFSISIPDEVAERKNYVTEKKISELAKKYKPDQIVSFYYMNDLYAMHIDGYENNSMPMSYFISGWLARNEKQSGNKKNFLFLSNRLSLNDILNNPPEGLITALDSYGYTDVIADFQNGKAIYKEEIPTDRKVEYASSLYSCSWNGLYLYVVQYE